MSGHSKWSQIKHKKGATDAKRGQLFGKLVKEIAIAARSGSTDPAANARLRSALERAKDAGLPKENIARAIARARGNGEGAELSEILCEAAAPGGIAIIIEAITDSKNRTVNEIKHILTEHNGKLAQPGSLLWNFERVGRHYKPRATVSPPEDRKKSLENLLSALSKQDDVQEIYTTIA